MPTRLAYSIELEADGIEQARTEFTIDNAATRSCKTNRSFREIYRRNRVGSLGEAYYYRQKSRRILMDRGEAMSSVGDRSKLAGRVRRASGSW